ncbi:MAG: class I SAM-dependent methyltransferase [Pseudomonadota bacterium]
MTLALDFATPDYGYTDAGHAHSHGYLLGAVDRILEAIGPSRVFDLGCGNGSVVSHLSKTYSAMGVDASESGIGLARMAHPDLRFEVASAYDDLGATYGQFDAVTSLEVIEHLFDPRLYAERLYDLVAPGGYAVVSTPYHGYWKNLALAVSGKMDGHFTALWDGGHIKFWSIPTLSKLLENAGFEDLEFHRVGRVPQLAKSMICVARRPG